MNIPLTHAAEGLERRAFSVPGCFAMAEAEIIGWDERFALISGEIVPALPIDIMHENLKAWLVEAIIPQVDQTGRTYIEPTVHLSDDTFFDSQKYLVLDPLKQWQKWISSNSLGTQTGCLLARWHGRLYWLSKIKPSHERRLVGFPRPSPQNKFKSSFSFLFSRVE